MRRILFQETDFNSLPTPPSGFKYIGFDGPNFSYFDENGQIIQSVGPTGPTGPGGGGTSSSDRLISSNNLEVVLDSNGTLNTPLLLPVSFTAVCDDNHFDGTHSFSGSDWWEFEVHFDVNPDGAVETMINNIFPILTNPGYISGDVFIFTEEDHGIPGFNFELQLNDVVLPGGAGWTSNLSVTQPPVYPSTIESLGALKFTSNSNSLVLSTNGDLILPGGMEVGGVSLSIDGSDTILEKRLEETETDGIVTVTNAVGSKLTFNYNSIGMESYLDPDGPNNTSLSRVLVGPGAVEILSSEENVGGDATTGILVGGSGVQISTNDGVTTQTITVGGGVINLPEGGDIKDYLGNSVLSSSVLDVTYSELLTMIGDYELTTGKFYKITDFKTCYDQPNYNIYRNAITTGNYKVGETHSVIVMAISATALSVDAWQPDFPKDKIKYDVSYSTTYTTGGTAFGRITERIDEWNNRTDYDHREVLFRRYRHYYYDLNTLSGTIDISESGSVTGANTQFDVDFVVDDYLFASDGGNLVYKITEISSSQSMSVTGSYIPNLNGYNYHKGYKSSEPNLDGYFQYYQNNVDGSEDYLEFHTFKLNTETILDNKFGDYYSLMVWNENSFDLPNNVFGEDVIGTIIGHSFINNTFVDDVEETRIGDYCESNIYYSNSDFDDNVIGNFFYNNTILERFDQNTIKNSFQNNYIRGVFENNSIGDNFNNITTTNNFSNNNIGNDFQYNNIYQNFESNKIANFFYNNSIYNNFFRNKIGDTFENNTIGTINNVGGYDFENNTIGFWCKGNFFIGSIDSNEFGNYFWTNEILDSSYANKIGSDFQNNDVYSEFNFNIISNSCQNNTFGTSSRYNTLGGDFQQNIIGTEFEYNTIGSEFNTNIIGNYFKHNNIGNFFQLNTISYDFKQNSIGNYFNDNSISFNFAFNIIDDSFYGNTIENDFGFGGGQARGNKIGNYFYNNTVGEYFYDNIIADLFNNNTVGDGFTLNDIKANDIYNIDFEQYKGNIISISSFSPAIPGTDSIYYGVTCSGGQGFGATFDVTVSGSVVTNVTINQPGRLYWYGDLVTILGSRFGGTDGQDLTITLDQISNFPVVYTNTNSTIVRDSNGDLKLYYLGTMGIEFVGITETYD